MVTVTVPADNPLSLPSVVTTRQSGCSMYKQGQDRKWRRNPSGQMDHHARTSQVRFDTVSIGIP